MQYIRIASEEDACQVPEPRGSTTAAHLPIGFVFRAVSGWIRMVDFDFDSLIYIGYAAQVSCAAGHAVDPDA